MIKIEDLFHYGIIMTDFVGEVIRGKTIDSVRILTFATEEDQIFYCKMVNGEVEELKELNCENLG